MVCAVVANQLRLILILFPYFVGLFVVVVVFFLLLFSSNGGGVWQPACVCRQLRG